MSIVLEAELREITGKKCRALRNQNIVPAQVYNSEGNTNIQADHNTLKAVLKEAGSTALIEIKAGDKVMNALTREVQMSLDRQRVLHVDFFEVDMTKKVIASVPIELTGDAPLVAEGAILIVGVASVEVEALPADIPQSVAVSVEGLKEFTDTVTSGDIPLPEGVTLVSNPDVIVATCGETRATRQAAQALRDAEKAGDGGEAPAEEASEESAEASE